MNQILKEFDSRLYIFALVAEVAQLSVDTAMAMKTSESALFLTLESLIIGYFLPDDMQCHS